MIEFAINVRLDDAPADREDVLRDRLATIVEEALALAGYTDAKVGTRGHLA